MDLLCVFVGARRRSVPTVLFATPAALFQAVELQSAIYLAAAARAGFVEGCQFFFICPLISLILFYLKGKEGTHARVSVDLA